MYTKFRIGTTPNCPWENVAQTTEHILQECPTHSELRQTDLAPTNNPTWETPWHWVKPAPDVEFCQSHQTPDLTDCQCHGNAEEEEEEEEELLFSLSKIFINSIQRSPVISKSMG